ncbi:MAG: hypothetical protein HY023_15340 [Chloroflexi bacterium]|nr:hypothetical protein [Chloroflexota bacterium]MBI3761690.1 hypothetical protein [Chloroflexota bacterium]
MPKRSRRHVELTPKEAASSAAAIATFVGFLVFYFFGEALLNPNIHPEHWLAGGIGGAASYGVAYGIVYWRRTHA